MKSQSITELKRNKNMENSSTTEKKENNQEGNFLLALIHKATWVTKACSANTHEHIQPIHTHEHIQPIHKSTFSQYTHTSTLLSNNSSITDRHWEEKKKTKQSYKWTSIKTLFKNACNAAYRGNALDSELHRNNATLGISYMREVSHAAIRHQKGMPTGIGVYVSVWIYAGCEGARTSDKVCVCVLWPLHTCALMTANWEC